jgi:hypothetical protein
MRYSKGNCDARHREADALGLTSPMHRSRRTAVALLALAALAAWLARRGGRRRRSAGERRERDAGERRLDEALAETFPASDPIAVHIE